MELKSEKINSANGKVEAVISKEDIKKSEDKLAKQIAKTAKVDGFRKGKVPAALIKKQYGAQIEQDARNELIREAYENALAELKVGEILGEPSVVKFDEKDDVIETEIKFCFRPEFDLGDYSKHVPTHKEIKVADKDVKKAVQEAANSTVVPTKIARARKLKEGDFAIFDFEGKIDGEVFQGGTAKDYQLEIGSKSFIEGFEDGMLGMKPGESKDLELSFPANYQAKELAGKDVVFSVTLNEIRERKDAELNDELAKKLLPQDEEATMEKFEGMVKEQLLQEKKMKLFADELKPKLLEELEKAYTFELPDLIVEKEIDHLVQSKVQGMKEEELKEISGNEEKIKELREGSREEAEARVKTTLIVDALSSATQTTVSDQEVMQVIYYEAMRSGMNPQEAMEMYQKQNLLPVIKMSMVEDKVLNKLLEDKNSPKEEKEAK